MTERHIEAAADPTSIGAVAKIFADVPTEIINLAIVKQKEQPTTRLGEILVKLNAITPGALRRLLTKQRDLRAGKAGSKDVMVMLEYATRMAVRDANNIEEIANIATKRKR